MMFQMFRFYFVFVILGDEQFRSLPAFWRIPVDLFVFIFMVVTRLCVFLVSVFGIVTKKMTEKGSKA